MGDVNFESIDERLVFAVVCKADVLAPVGKGSETASTVILLPPSCIFTAEAPAALITVTLPEMGWVAGKFETETELPLASTLSVANAKSLMSRLVAVTVRGLVSFESIETKLALPAICKALVEAPVGRGSETAEIAHGLVPWVTVTESVESSSTQLLGRGILVTMFTSWTATGGELPPPSPIRRYVPAMGPSFC
jgi:hypothetical protein